MTGEGILNSRKLSLTYFEHGEETRLAMLFNDER